MRRRLLGVKLIALYFAVKATVLIVATGVAYLSPELRSEANLVIVRVSPSIQQFRLQNYGVNLAPLFSLFEGAKGLGVWFLQRWARTLILLDLIYKLGSAGIAVAVLWNIDKQFLMDIISSSYFVVGVALSISILGYVLNPEVKRAFGVPDEESW